MHFSKNKDTLSCNQHTTLHIRKSTFTLHHQSNLQTPFKFDTLPKQLFFSFLVQDAIREHKLPFLTVLLTWNGFLSVFLTSVSLTDRVQPFHSVGWTSTCMSRPSSHVLSSKDMVLCSFQCIRQVRCKVSQPRSPGQVHLCQVSPL